MAWASPMMSKHTCLLAFSALRTHANNDQTERALGFILLKKLSMAIKGRWFSNQPSAREVPLDSDCRSKRLLSRRLYHPTMTNQKPLCKRVVSGMFLSETNASAIRNGAVSLS